MSLDTNAVTSVNPPVRYNGGVLLSWAGTLAAGQVWQVYAGGQLLGHTSQSRFHAPAPSEPTQFAIGAVAAADASTSFASSLPPQPRRRATLSWQGGRGQDPVDGDVMGFHVYGETSPGGGINYATILADLPVSVGRMYADGFGLGGFGAGGFGYAPGNYAWTSGTLASGTWHWAIVPYDAAGNEGAGATTSTLITGPPGMPAPGPDGKCLNYTLLGYGQAPFSAGGFGEVEIELTWLASPG